MNLQVTECLLTCEIPSALNPSFTSLLLVSQHFSPTSSNYSQPHQKKMLLGNWRKRLYNPGAGMLFSKASLSRDRASSLHGCPDIQQRRRGERDFAAYSRGQFPLASHVAFPCGWLPLHVSKLHHHGATVMPSPTRSGFQPYKCNEALCQICSLHGACPFLSPTGGNGCSPYLLFLYHLAFSLLTSDQSHIIPNSYCSQFLI